MSTKLGTLNKDQDMLLANDIATEIGTSNSKVASQNLVKSYNDTTISNLLTALYPTNSLYITANNATKCPLESLIAGSTWELVAKDSTIWGYDSANTTHTAKGLGGTLDAGLPMPTIDDPGHIHTFGSWSHNETLPIIKKEEGTDLTEPIFVSDCMTSENTTGITISEDSIYKSATTTVQPKAMLVNIWKRTA